MKDDDIAMYFAHLAEFFRDTSFRFNDLFPLEIHIEKELVSLQNDEDLKQKFKTSYQAFWMQAAIPERYPALWIDIKLFFHCFFDFPPGCCVLTKQRNELSIAERGDLRLLLTSIHPDVVSFIAMHQVNPSH